MILRVLQMSGTTQTYRGLSEEGKMRRSEASHHQLKYDIHHISLLSLLHITCPLERRGWAKLRGKVGSSELACTVMAPGLWTRSDALYIPENEPNILRFALRLVGQTTVTIAE